MRFIEDWDFPEHQDIYAHRLVKVPVMRVMWGFQRNLRVEGKAAHMWPREEDKWN